MITVDGLSNGLEELHPVQEAMVKNSGAQCGFCTPGFVMSMYGLFLKTKKPNKAQILNSIQGNLCRCTGYGPIISAAEDLSKSFFCSNDFLIKNNKKWAQKLNDLRNIVQDDYYRNYLETKIKKELIDSFLEQSSFIINSPHDTQEYDFVLKKSSTLIFDEAGVHRGAETLKTNRLVVRFVYKDIHASD